MKITFNAPTPHLDPQSRRANRMVVEVFRNGRFVAAIYPVDDDNGGLKIVSNHIDTVVHDEGGGKIPPVPAVEIKFT